MHERLFSISIFFSLSSACASPDHQFRAWKTFQQPSARKLAYQAISHKIFLADAGALVRFFNWLLFPFLASIFCRNDELFLGALLLLVCRSVCLQVCPCPVLLTLDYFHHKLVLFFARLVFWISRFPFVFEFLRRKMAMVIVTWSRIARGDRAMSYFCTLTWTFPTNFLCLSL